MTVDYADCGGLLRRKIGMPLNYSRFVSQDFFSPGLLCRSVSVNSSGFGNSGLSGVVAGCGADGDLLS